MTQCHICCQDPSQTVDKLDTGEFIDLLHLDKNKISVPLFTLLRKSYHLVDLVAED